MKTTTHTQQLRLHAFNLRLIAKELHELATKPENHHIHFTVKPAALIASAIEIDQHSGPPAPNLDPDHYRQALKALLETKGKLSRTTRNQTTKRAAELVTAALYSSITVAAILEQE